MFNQVISQQRRQRGAVLIVALVLLLVLTVLGTAGIQDTVMEERMAGNFRDVNVALQAAEAAIGHGEANVVNPTTFKSMLFNGSDGTAELDPLVNPMGSGTNPLSAGNYGLTVLESVLTESGGDLLVSAPPKYFVEKLPEIELPDSDLTSGFQDRPPVVNYYRVTGKAWGITSNTEVILQSTYFR